MLGSTKSVDSCQTDSCQIANIAPVMKLSISAADVSTVAFALIKNQNLESALSNDCHTDYSKPNAVNYGKIQKRMKIGFKLH